MKKDRAGELALGNSFLGLPLPARGAGPAQKPGPGWNGSGGAAQAREMGPTWKLQKRNFTSTRVILFYIFFAFFSPFFCIFFAFFLHFFPFFYIFFAFPRLGVIFFAFFFVFPKLGIIFWHFFFVFPKSGVIFCIFLHFLDRVCHLMTKRQENEQCFKVENDKKRQKNDKKITKQ